MRPPQLAAARMHADFPRGAAGVARLLAAQLLQSVACPYPRFLGISNLLRIANARFSGGCRFLKQLLDDKKSSASACAPDAHKTHPSTRKAGDRQKLNNCILVFNFVLCFDVSGMIHGAF